MTMPEVPPESALKVQPVIMLDAFTREPKSNWDDWIGHFKSVA